MTQPFLPGLAVLRRRYPWPEAPPEVPEDPHGWLCPDTAAALVSNVSTATQLVVELGAWLGCSTRAILQHAPNASVVSVDTWLGSPEHWADTDQWKRRLPTLYEVFLRNQWPWRERVIPLRADSLVGLGEIFEVGLRPDLVYVDSKHTVFRVAAELAVCSELFPTAAIVGDDYNNGAVRLAADRHARDWERPMIVRGAAYVFPGWTEHE